jgi:hypothetical protein
MHNYRRIIINLQKNHGRQATKIIETSERLLPAIIIAPITGLWARKRLSDKDEKPELNSLTR